MTSTNPGNRWRVALSAGLRGAVAVLVTFAPLHAQGPGRGAVPPGEALFTAHKLLQDRERQLAGSRWQDTGYVFTTRSGTPVDARDLLRDYYRITRPKAKDGTPVPLAFLPPVKFHALRHSAATLLLAQGVSPKYISDLLGHSQVSFTMDIYAHVIKKVQRKVADTMDAILTLKPQSDGVATETATTAVSSKPC